MKVSTAYQLHEGFIAPARPYATFWRFAIGIVLAFSAYVAFTLMFFQGFLGLFGLNRGPFLHQLQSGETPIAMYVLLFSFVFMTLSVGIAAKLLHRRKFATLFGPLHQCWRDFRAVSMLLVLVMLAIFLLPPWGMGAPFVPNMTLGTWIMLLAPSLLVVLIQTSAEEIVFRGYVQQQLAARFKSPIVWMVLPAVLFALGHYVPGTAGDNAVIIALWAGMFGILMADLTARAGTLGPAIAVHFWNNVSAILIVSLPGDMSGLALYLTPFGMDDAEALRAWLPVDFAIMIVLWLTARLAIRR